ncbi:hypothetical protein M378DRAFT_26241 [Amanita muscaria Koide BX008]|uniref:Uncharacterized protein n=1 Tax=Amanita muscaria (strain Koide BX008) TaxID=946122 RepID=A0A0C2WHU8_AMAMK|nr:hypothetical protein M378DRAFT_26241 [Amanita muscaria Koide BX008]
MSHEARTPRTSPPKRFGPPFIVGAALVGATLYGFWNFLARKQERKERAGAVPHYEQLLAHVGSKDADHVGQLPTSQVDRRNPAPPTEKHDAGHATIQTAGKGNQEGDTTSAPSPQRGKNEDPTKAYTKSPAYADNYGKTSHAQNASQPS